MAFNRYTAQAVGTVETEIILDDPSGSTVVIGFNISNVSVPAQSITATASMVDSLDVQTNLVKDVIIPAGDAAELLQGKIVLKTGDSIKVSTGNGTADVIVSTME